MLIPPRLFVLACLAVYFSLVPQTIYPYLQDPRTHLSNWHQSDVVPYAKCFSYEDLMTGSEWGKCFTVLESAEGFEIRDAS